MSRSLVTSAFIAATALFLVATTSHAFPTLPNATVDHEVSASVVRAAVASFVAAEIDVAELAAGTSPWQLSAAVTAPRSEEGDSSADAAEVLTAVAVPEPPTYAIAMVAGVLGAGAMARKKLKK